MRPHTEEGSGARRRYLHGQRERVPQDQHEHDVFKLAGVDDFPEFELRLVFRNVDLYRLSFEGVVDALALQPQETAVRIRRADAKKRENQPDSC